MNKSEQIKNLAQALNFYDYKVPRDAAFGIESEVKPEHVVRRGIADLDFDPYFLLGTGETSPDGWAVKK